VKDEGVSESPIPGSWILRVRVTPWAVIMSTPSNPNTSDGTFIHGEVEGMMWYARVWVEYQRSDHEIRTTKEHETLQVDLEVARGEIIILTSMIKEVKASTQHLYEMFEEKKQFLQDLKSNISYGKVTLQEFCNLLDNDI